MPELDAERDLLKFSVYNSLAQFWANLNLKDELWEDDARMLLLLQKALIDEAELTLQGHFDESSLKKFREYVDTFKIRIVFTEDDKAKRFKKKITPL